MAMINVLDYGPSVDGSGRITNLRALIVSALTDTGHPDPTYNRTLFLPRGEYLLASRISNLDSDLTAVQRLHLVGDGAVISRASTFTDSQWIFITGQDRGLSLEGAITFDGKTSPTSGSPPSGISTTAARSVVLVAGDSINARARGVYVGPEVRFRDLWWRENSTSFNIDHAIQANNARDVEIHCQSENVRGWTVWLETVDDFTVSGCRMDKTEWSGIEMRRACRRGIVIANTVRNASGEFGGAIDMLGETAVLSDGTPVLNERVLIADNWVHCTGLYGAGLRLRGSSFVDVIDNTVELEGTAPSGLVRAGIVFGNKAYTDATLHARSICTDVRIANNRILVHVPVSGGDTGLRGGVHGMNDGGAHTTPPASKNITIVGNELMEVGTGRFNGFGVRYGINATDDGPTQGLVIRGNYGVASVQATGIGYGAVSVVAHGTTPGRGISELTVERNTFRCRTTSAGSSAGGISGNVTGSLVHDNVFQDYTDPF